MNLPARIEKTANLVWDGNYNLVGYIPDSALLDDEGCILLDNNHPIAQFLTDGTRGPKSLTCDGKTGRWHGLLRTFTTRGSLTRFEFERLPEDLRGWTIVECQRCHDRLYAGLWLTPDDHEALLMAHETTCPPRIKS